MVAPDCAAPPDDGHAGCRVAVQRPCRGHLARGVVPVLLAVALLASCTGNGTSPRRSVQASPTSRSTVTTLRSAVSNTTTAPSQTTVSSTPASGTREVTFEPLSEQGTINPALEVTTTVSGNCFSSGVAGNSSYRCLSGHDVYDPCFSAPKATSGPLLCTSDPAANDVIRFDTGALPGPSAGAPETRVWAMELSNGQVCVVVNAAWSGLGPFGCQPSPPGPLSDCHTPAPSDPWWTAACQDQTSDSSPFTAFQVNEVWM